MLLSMLLASFGHVIGRMAHLSVRHMSMMSRRFMVTSFMLGGGFLMVLSSCVATIRCGLVMLCGLRVARHIVSFRICHGYLANRRTRSVPITPISHFSQTIDRKLRSSDADPQRKRQRWKPS